MRPGEFGAAATILLGLLATWWLYQAGLVSAFLLDDKAQLRSLAGLGDDPNLRQWIAYATSSAASTIGRPLAVVTFALNYYAWPYDPWSFKHFNLMIHLVNGCLVVALTHRVWRLVPTASHPWWAAAIVGTAWTLHPVHVNTVLYTVQRMTELSALFTLLGLIAYLHGRNRAAAGATGSGFAWMTGGIAAGIGLGVLCQENAILLPVYAFALEATVLRSTPRPPHWRLWSAVVLAGPLVALCLHVASHAHSYFVESYSVRDFTAGERLLTEPRVLFLYLRQILLPTPGSLTFFYDDYPPSRGWFDPPVTALAIAGIAALATAAIRWRCSWPLASLGVLWFLGGQLLESTALPLDLVFEHRNYLPATGVLWTVAAIWPRVVHHVTTASLHRAARFVPFVLLLALGAVTSHQARVWGDPRVQATLWYDARPGSERAAQFAAGVAAVSGNTHRTLEIYQALAERRPGDLAPYVGWLLLTCIDPGISGPDRDTMLALAARSTIRNSMTINSLNTIQDLRLRGTCTTVDAAYLHRLLAILADNPHMRNDLASIRYLDAELYYYEDRIDLALERIRQTFAVGQFPEVALIEVAWLYDAGRLSEAREALARARAGAGIRGQAKVLLLQPEIDAWERRLAAPPAAG